VIARANRFHGYNSLRQVYTRGSVVRGQFCALKYLQNPKRSSYRAAVVVSRKVHKSAVVRNRIRRRIYEIIRMNIPTSNTVYDLVFVVYSDQAASIEAPELRRQIESQLAKAGVITDTAKRVILDQKEPNSHV
jgi:ribonuclease P protein component